MDRTRPVSRDRHSLCVWRSMLVCAMGMFFAFGAVAQALAPGGEEREQDCSLRVDAEGLRNAKGVVGVLVFRTPEGWPESVGKSFRHEAEAISANARAATVTIHGLPAGDYAVVALHDENRNMKLDRNVFGWPKEGFGFSNNPRIGLGPPPFAQSLVRVACPATEVTVRIVYK